MSHLKDLFFLPTGLNVTAPMAVAVAGPQCLFLPSVHCWAIGGPAVLLIQDPVLDPHNHPAFFLVSLPFSVLLCLVCMSMLSLNNFVWT